MNRYRLIAENPAQPSEKDVQAQKDFKKVKTNYHRMTKRIYKKPIYKDRKLLIGLILVLIILWLILLEL